MKFSFNKNKIVKVLTIVVFVLLSFYIIDGVKDRIIATFQKSENSDRIDKDGKSSVVNNSQDENEEYENQKLDNSNPEEEGINNQLIIALFLNGIKDTSNRFYNHYFNKKLDFIEEEVGVIDIYDKEGHLYITFSNTPMIGGQTPVGYDEITFVINDHGEITLDKFKHIKSYDLPAKYMDYIIKPLG